MEPTPPPASLPDPDFPQLVLQLRARLHRYCSRMTGSVLDGEDVVQDTLVKANECFDAASVRNVEAWLFRIAHNTAMDLLRRRKREQAVFADDDVEELPGVDADAAAERRHVATTALRTFMRLPPVQRSSVILADVLGYGLDEAAGVMGTTVPAVKAALHRGRTRLRELATQAGGLAPAAMLSARDQSLLDAYAARFNARDFDALRDMLAEDARLDLVARRKPMPMGGGEYFRNYAMVSGLRMTPATVEGRPAVWVDPVADEGPGATPYFIVLGFVAGKVRAIRDFRYARYAAEGLAS